MKEILINTVFYSTKTEIRRKEMSFKKIILKTVTFIAILSVVIGGGINATAEESINDIKNIKKFEFLDKDIKYAFEVKNGNVDGNKTTDIGGISVGTAKNRLFVVKCNGKEQYATLYYYSKYYDTNLRKNPKKIGFDNYLLGHANAMAIDNDYIYVTMWQIKEKGEKSKILQISRSDIASFSEKVYDKKDVTTNAQKKAGKKVEKEAIAIVKKAGNGHKIIITTNTYTTVKKKTEKKSSSTKSDFNCKEYSPITISKDDSGQEIETAYTRSITSITKYSTKKYDNGTYKTVFIINYKYSRKRSKLQYTFATLEGGKFVVSLDDIFTVYNPAFRYNFDSDDFQEMDLENFDYFNENYDINGIRPCTMQDVFYDSSCGLLIPIWLSKGENKDVNEDTRDLILRVDISNVKNKTELLPKSIAFIYPLEYDDTTTNPGVAKFEFESIAFVKKDKDLNESFKFTISCNIMLDTYPQESMDCIIELKNTKKFLA